MATVRVVKRKWNGSVSTIDTANPLVVEGVCAWFVLAGSQRERPNAGAVEVVGTDELWVAVPGEWWVLCAYTDSMRSLNGFKVHAAAPFDPSGGDVEIVWVDLDLDFEVAGDEEGVKDEAQFHTHAQTMGYPRSVVQGAWSGISTVATRYATGDWPFDGSMQEWLRVA